MTARQAGPPRPAAAGNPGNARNWRRGRFMGHDTNVTAMAAAFGIPLDAPRLRHGRRSARRRARLHALACGSTRAIDRPASLPEPIARRPAQTSRPRVEV
ncbi:hypothetical protein ACRAWD_00915 [Caulobacter segnis]